MVIKRLKGSKEVLTAGILASVEQKLNNMTICIVRVVTSIVLVKQKPNINFFSKAYFILVIETKTGTMTT